MKKFERGRRVNPNEYKPRKDFGKRIIRGDDRGEPNVSKEFFAKRDIAGDYQRKKKSHDAAIDYFYGADTANNCADAFCGSIGYRTKRKLSGLLGF